MHGGGGTIRQGIRRELVVRCDLGEGLHIYGDGVPEGMVATALEVSGPPGLVFEELQAPPTETLRMESIDVELPVWSGQVDFVVPFYAVGELASETRPLDQDDVTIEVGIRYQACDDQMCFPPKSEKMALTVPLDVIDVPSLGMHRGHGQRESATRMEKHLLRLIWRKFKENPAGLPRFFWKSFQLERQASQRRRNG
ncbi:MAG: protein-disulfide reductase DsbD domain-containing protein [Myxococcota bacterium]